MKQATSGTTRMTVDVARLRSLIASYGEVEAARLLEVSRQTLARSVAGFGVRRGTAELIRNRLDELGKGDDGP